MTNKGQKIEFDDHYFLLDYLQDDAQRIVVQKPTQVGVSFTTILKVLYSTAGDSISVIYTLPTGGEARDFVVSKFDPIIERSRGLRQQVVKVAFRAKPIWSTTMKRIGESYFFFRGSWSAWKAQSIDADILVVDELDFQKEDIRQMYEERLEGSKSLDVIYSIGYPSIPNYGISALYNESDQKEWWIQCPDCLKWQVLTWPDSISRQKKTYVCKFCRKDLPDLARKRGKWIAKFPDRKLSGYAINKLMAPWVPAERIIKSFKDDSPKHFHNYTLGLPFVEHRNELTLDILKQTTVTEELWQKLKTEHVVCGIDQGDNFQMVVGTVGKNGAVIIAAEILKTPKEVEDRLSHFNPEIVVIDMMPDKHTAKMIQQKYGFKKFFLANLRTWGSANVKKDYFEVLRQKGIINLERTESLDFMFDSIKDGYLKFKHDCPFLGEVFKHLQHLVPDYQERWGVVQKVWKKVGGKDDFAHSLNFFLVGAKLLFPGSELFEGKIIPARLPDEALPGSQEWCEEHFERVIRRTANPTGTIVIHAKR